MKEKRQRGIETVAEYVRNDQIAAEVRPPLGRLCSGVCIRQAGAALGGFQVSAAAARWFEMSNHLGILDKERGDRSLRCVDDIVPIAHGKTAVDLQTEFDERAVARVPGTKIVNFSRAGTGEGRLSDAPALLIRQLMVQ